MPPDRYVHPTDEQVRAILAAGLNWLYETVQPEGSFPSHHGYGFTAGSRNYRFIPANDSGLPVVVVSVAHPQYVDVGFDRQLVNPLDGPAEMRRLAEALSSLGRTVVNQWNGGPGSDTGSLLLKDRAHVTLLAGLQVYRAGCPDHPGKVLCSWEGCPWYKLHEQSLTMPKWPTGLRGEGCTCKGDPCWRDPCPTRMTRLATLPYPRGRGLPDGQ